MSLTLLLTLCFIFFFSIPRTRAQTLTRANPNELSAIRNVEFSPSMSSNNAPRRLNVTFSLAGGRTIGLDLSRNDDIFSQPIFVNYLGSDGTVRSVESLPAGRHLAYAGGVHFAQEHGNNREKAGWARISVYRKNGVNLLEGAFSLDGIDYHVQTDYNYRRTILAGEDGLPATEKPYSIVWRDGQELGTKHDEREKRQLADNFTGCSFDHINFNRAQMASIYRGLESRQNRNGDSWELINTINSTEGCSNSRKIALLGIATDCTYTAGFDSTEDLRQHVLAQINAASQVFEQSFNISLRVRNLTISDSRCPSRQTNSAPWNLPCGSGLDISDRLDKFSQWRSGIRDTENAVWSLLSTCNSASTIGLAWMGTVCRQGSNSRGGSQSPPSTNVVVRTRNEWQVIAHEIAHNFGAVHDCTEGCDADLVSRSESCCPYNEGGCDAGGAYIMNPGLNGGMSRFSPCTTGNVCTLMGRNLIRTDCLRSNEDEPTISIAECENGECHRREEDQDLSSRPNDQDSWIDKNRAIFITICVVGGIIGLVAIFGFTSMFWSKARRNRLAPRGKEMNPSLGAARGSWGFQRGEGTQRAPMSYEVSQYAGSPGFRHA